ncbi:hypothetical protein Poli38472_014247 [Pythium oligandrum]|uniref:Sodium/calcium exchanger membrane region domain-containing protein n=1 Tax=Pythium oligandrum TaxID=41045 RepID=A0A8K1CK46_PYTOL|nr:hypothetical protein Poli38472_014247 [Pythium oligandrum]|eukprot:TMW64130.1 hypothetical protein Poli38472_014247 [Pythium oligandrum]
MRSTLSTRRALRTRIRSVCGVVLLVSGVLAALASFAGRSDALEAPRRLTETTNATNEGECADLAHWEQHGGIALYIFLLLYLFVALAIVCDDYFVSSLEKITDALGLSQDVAGATFMAAGSSAPELFVSLADNVFAKPQESLGIGTIVGSAIFNILIIIALSALLAGQVLILDWRPFLRDALWYCWSIIALTYTIWDGQVDVYESVVLFGSYIAYCVYMSQNERIVNACCKRPEDVVVVTEEEQRDEEAAERAAQLVAKQGGNEDKRAWTIDVERVEQSEAEVSDAATALPSRMNRQSSTGSQRPLHPHRLRSQSSKLNPMFRSKYRMFQYHPHMQERSASGRMLDESTAAPIVGNSETRRGSALQELSPHPVGVSHSPSAKKREAAIVASDVTEEPLGGYFEEIFAVPAGFLPKIWFILTRPIVIAMRLTIPDCRYPQFSGTIGFTSTFVLAIVWIAALSHFTVIWATKFGCIAGIPSALMGLTIIAAGTSIPDALSSILVARDGQGDMAVSNAVGSNVFDILLGLGLPFFLSNLIYKEPVVVVVDDLELSIFILFGVLLTVVVLLLASRWRLHPVTGAIMLVLYAAYVVFSYLRGLGQI